jgi:phosphoribosyl 1,2-cyclic phosphodiesterase
MEEGLTFQVLGARGSWPVSNPKMLDHGGRTTSFMIELGKSVTVLIDAGTGLVSMPDPDPAAEHEYHLFFTHYHLDHIQGLQFFRPLYRETSSFTFYGVPPEGMTVEGAVGGIYRAPWFPVPLAETPSIKRYVALDGMPVEVGPLSFATVELTHPQGVTGFRIQGPNASVVIATDHEAGDPAVDDRLVKFATGADYLLHDAQYTREEHDELYNGWGHSTWEDAVAIAARAQVGRLILTSHDPARTDAALEELIKLASLRFPATVAAREGMRLKL